MITTKEDIATLRKAIEEAIGRQPQTPKDFDLFSKHIFARTSELISRNTLRRIWGRMADEREPRQSTLNILSRFIGYPTFEAFLRQDPTASAEQPSSLVLLRHLCVINGLTRGDRLRLMWHPDRVCDVEYNGNQHFRVVNAVNTKLSVGDTFFCSLIIEGQPLYLNQLQHEKTPPAVYICGKQGGVRFEILEDL